MKFYFIAIVLLAAAALVEFKAKHVAAGIPRRMAALSQLPTVERDAALEQFNTKAVLRRSNMMEAVAVLSAVAGIAAWGASRRKKESGTQVIPILLVCAFVMVVLVLV
ncbi:MAG: hypothetical protein U1G05_19275 [Kiritimatiellia bacterium]